MPTWYEKEYGVADGGWQHPYLHNARYGILLGSGSVLENENYPAYWNDIEYLYEILDEDYNYLEEDIHLLYSVWGDEDHSGDDDRIDDEASKDGLLRAIEDISSRITKTDFLLIAYRGHGEDTKENGEIVDGSIRLASEENDINDDDDRPKVTHMRYSELGGHLDKLTYGRLAVIKQTCYSGSAIQHLEKEDRIIMASSKADEESYSTYDEYYGNENGAFFFEGIKQNGGRDVYEGVVKSLGTQETPKNLLYAFEKGYEAARNNGISEDFRSTPQISGENLAEKTYL